LVLVAVCAEATVVLRMKQNAIKHIEMKMFIFFFISI